MLPRRRWRALLRHAAALTRRRPPSGAVAAVDLGSNSFHMVVARPAEGELLIVDRLRDRVALAEGLDDNKRLTVKAQERALACLRRFGERIRPLDHGSVRAVGTNTLRQAKNARSFLARAEQALGHPIEVVSGREEARLIYLGVAHSTPDLRTRRLVVDIGGGSTECIVGERFEPIGAESLYMGCVGYSLRFFPGGTIRPKRFREAEIAARLELEPVKERLVRLGWKSVVGSSGTILAIARMLREGGLSGDGVTARALRALKDEVLRARSIADLRLPGLDVERAPVLPGGLAILVAIFDALGIERLDTTPSALREGLLWDLLGRIRHEDVRDRTIRAFTDRYHIDREQAARVEKTALALLDGAARGLGLERETWRPLLAWAARLHEIGLFVSYAGYHKHGGYLLGNAEMPGFSRDDQAVLAALVRAHRRKFSRKLFADLPETLAGPAPRAAALLRLSVLLHRNRRRVPIALGSIRARRDRIQLGLPKLSARQPLTQADLEREAAQLAAAGITLVAR